VLLGDVELTIVSDGRWWQDAGAHFGVVPRVLWEPIIDLDDRHRVPMALNCLLFCSAGKTILVDTGLGSKLSGKERDKFGFESRHGLLDNLHQLGVSAEDVDVVINTHLHSDHCGGNTVLNSSGVPKPTFPRAEYWIQRLEWADARYPNERTGKAYLPENLLPVEEEGQLRLLNGDTPVTEEVRCVVTRGHTRSHQSVIFHSQGHTAIYLGDLAPWKENIEKLAWTPAVDVAPLENMETKRSIRQWALEEKALLLFEHDPRIAAGYLHQDGETYHVEPVDLGESGNPVIDP
jgi:glyoxylase-like metal-dependent hydrolase (beta-lactamase superfamily II)